MFPRCQKLSSIVDCINGIVDEEPEDKVSVAGLYKKMHAGKEESKHGGYRIEPYTLEEAAAAFNSARDVFVYSDAAVAGSKETVSQHCLRV